MTPERIRVDSAAGSYEVLIGRGLLRDVGRLVAEIALGRRPAIVADETVAELYGIRVRDAFRDVGLDADLVTFAPGERSKSRQTWARITDALIDAGYGRDAAVVALGGGVTGDLAGFVAATFMRGVPIVHVPTSLLAMVDASVGGKTGLDVPGGKNLVGAFHPPVRVIIDPDTVRSASRSARAEGLVEAVKHGAILDERYFERVRREIPAVLAGDGEAAQSVVVGSVEIKSRVVSEDEREAGYRQVLNFGHTLGHALEAASGFTLTHGAAVCLGMILEARLGERIGATRPGTSDRLAAVLELLELPTRVPSGVGLDRVLAFASRDKKARDGVPRYVLLETIGRVAHQEAWSRPADPSDVLGVLS